MRQRIGATGRGRNEPSVSRDTSLKRDVAIKVLLEHWSRDAGRLQRFELEAQATAARNRPSIVSIFHVGQHDGCTYIVTELLLGETLRDRLRRGPMRAREACDCGIDIAAVAWRSRAKPALFIVTSNRKTSSLRKTDASRSWISARPSSRNLPMVRPSPSRNTPSLAVARPRAVQP